MPRSPHPITGTITGIDGNAAQQCVVYIYNLSNGDSMDDKTNASGIYILDFANATKEWTAGQKILIRAWYPGNLYQMAQRINTIEGASQTQNLTLKVTLPIHTKDVNENKLHVLEHDPISNAKQVIIKNPVDSSADAVVCIEYEHHEIHEGSHYFLRSFFTLTSTDDDLDFAVITPDTEKQTHLLFSVDGTGQTELYMYEDSDFDSDGTPVIARNSDRNSSNTSGMIITTEPTINSIGTLISSQNIGIAVTPAKTSGGTINRDDEIILKSNTKYIIRMVTKSDANIISYRASWYEHTPKEK